MNSYRRDLTDPRSLALNQEAVELHVDDLYLVQFLDPGSFVPFSGSAHGTAGQSAGLGKWPTIDYPNGSSTYAAITLRRPAYWLRGNFKVTILYTSQTAGIANFGLLASVGATPKLGNYSNTGITVLVSTTGNLPGPAAADDEKEYTFYTSTAQLTSYHRMMYVRIGRDGAGDANNNVMQLTGVVLEFIPARTEI